MPIKDNETLKQIAQLLASLPSEYLFQPDLMTQDQIDEWHKTRTTQCLVAECWRSKFIQEGYYPIDQALDRKEISKCKAELILQTVDELKARWELCQVAEKYVKDAHSFLQYFTDYADNFPRDIAQLWYKFFHKVCLRQYPFQSTYDLFAETVKEDVNGSFSVCLESYYEVPIKKWRQASQYFIEIVGKAELDGIYPKLNAIEEQKLKRKLAWGKVRFSWSGMTLWVCQIEAPNDPLLRDKLIAYNKSLKEVLNLTAKASRKVPGFAWDKGQMVYTSGAGGVYRSR